MSLPNSGPCPAAARIMRSFSVSWVDMLVVVLVMVGIWRGKKRGMSEELLDILKWVLIVAVAGLLYEPSGRFLATFNVFSLLACYVWAYLLIAFAVFLTVAFIRKHVGAKLVGSDVFGRAEYYLGMAAGGFRYFCILIVAMAFLNARYYSPEEKQASVRYQEDNFGTRMFPTLPELQDSVFDQSFSGRATHDYLNVLLIKPTAPADKSLSDERSMARRREGAIDQILDKK